jgi:hypothetical protein
MSYNIADPGPPGGGGSRQFDSVLEPGVRSITVGQSLTYTYRLLDRVNGREITSFGDVAWTNEQPAVVRLVSPVEGCGTRCATVTGLVPGTAQIRAYLYYEGARIDGAMNILVR